MRSDETVQTRIERRLPLALPRELWATLSPAQRALYRRAEALLHAFGTSRRVLLTDLFAQGPRAEVLRALEVLGGMSLVAVESDGDRPTVELRALPEEHLRIVGPDGKSRWLFVARPLDPPKFDPALAN